MEMKDRAGWYHPFKNSKSEIIHYLGIFSLCSYQRVTLKKCRKIFRFTRSWLKIEHLSTGYKYLKSQLANTFMIGKVESTVLSYFRKDLKPVYSINYSATIFYIGIVGIYMSHLIIWVKNSLRKIIIKKKGHRNSMESCSINILWVILRTNWIMVIFLYCIGSSIPKIKRES
jgi:hypothetical protein